MSSPRATDMWRGSDLMSSPDVQSRQHPASTIRAFRAGRDSGTSERGRDMRTRILLAAVASAALCTGRGGVAAAAPDGNDNRSFTMAVYGDSPYGTNNADTSQTDAT